MEEKEFERMTKIIRLTLLRIGIRNDLKGFLYLCKAIEIVILNPYSVHRLCKSVYAEVAKAFNIKVDSIERDIRHAIEDNYINRDFLEFNRMFNLELFTIHDKPTVGEFIKLVAEYYNLGLARRDKATRYLYEEDWLYIHNQSSRLARQPKPRLFD